MSENKRNNELNENDDNFEVHNSDTANKNIDEHLDSPANIVTEVTMDVIPSSAAENAPKDIESPSEHTIVETTDNIISSEDELTVDKPKAISTEDDVSIIDEDVATVEDEIFDADEDVATAEDEIFDADEDVATAEDEIFDADEDVVSTEDEFSENSVSERIDADEKITENDEEGQEDEKRQKKAVGSRFVDSLFDFIELFIFSLAAVFIITTFFLRHSVVDGTSMENTLFDGEHIIISDLFYTPKRGDIIVCEDYSTELPIPIVKRVIALAGDRVEIDMFGNVKVNGEFLDESAYVHIDPNFSYECDPLDIVVPEGEIFVMGDHRNVSSDSRKIGTIKEDSILGKVLFRFYPFDKFGKVE